MPQPDNLMKMTMQFDLWGASGAAEDIAEFNIWGSDISADVDDWDGFLQDIADGALAAWIADVPDTRFSPAVHLSSCTVGRYDTAGHVQNEKRAVADPTDWVGGADDSLPWGSSLAISLYCYERGQFVLQGKSKRGRIYLPPLGTSALNAGPSGEISVGNATDLRDAIGTWLHDVLTIDSTHASTFFTPGVLSKTHNYITIVSYLSVDNKLDSQRRREKQQLATISTVAWP